MTLEVASIALKVDSTDATKAKVALDQMGQAGGTAAAGLSRTEAAAKSAAQAIASANAATAGSSRAALQQATAARGTADALRATGQQAKLTGQQTAQLSAQLQDFFVQVQAGGSPLTAFIQQGSQLSAVFGGAVPALQALGSVVFSVGGALTAAAGAVAALGAAFLVGREQSAEFARAITLSGNAAGLTEGQFSALAESISNATGTTIGSARDTLLGLAGSGRVTGESLTQAATAAQLLSKVTGQAADDITKDFIKAAESPGKFAAEVNRSYNFLSASQLSYIRGLEDQGRQQDALAATLSLLIPRLQEAAGQTTGLAAAFNEAKREASAFVDSLTGLFRNGDEAKRLAQLRSEIEQLQKAGQKAPLLFGASVAEKLAEANAIERTLDAQRKQAAYQEINTKQRNAEIAFADLRNKYLTKEEEKKKAIAELDAKAAAAGTKGNADYRTALAEINKRFAPTSDGVAKAQLAADIAAIRSLEQQRLQIYNQSESIIDALRQAGRLKEGEYYDAKRAFVELDRQTQEQALQAEIARLQRFKGTAQENIETQKQIADARTKLAEVQSTAAAKTILLDIQQKSAVDALKRAFSELEFSAVNAYRALERRVDMQVAGVGQGDLERQRTQELFSIREQYTRQLEQLDADYRNGSLRGQEAEYQRRKLLIQDSMEFEVRKTEEGYARMDAARAVWQNGASRALQNYADQSKDIAGQVEQAMSSAFNGMEDALVRFVTTGKLSFSDMATSIVADITRIIIKQQIANALAGAMGGGGGGGFLSSVIGGLFGAATGGSGMPDGVPTRGGRAAGGPVSRGSLYEINESGRGPGEILNVGGRQYLMAMASGSVNANAGGAVGGFSQHNTFVVQGAIDRRTQQQVAAQAGRAAQAALARNG